MEYLRTSLCQIKKQGTRKRQLKKFEQCPVGNNVIAKLVAKLSANLVA